MSRCLIAASLTFASLASGLKVTPTQKVIEMLTEMKNKGEKDMSEEQKTYFFYKEWVEDETRKLGFNIKDAAKTIDELIAFISKAQSDAKALGRKIKKLDAEIEKLEGEKADATKVRETERAEYMTMSTDLKESEDALTRAIAKLSSEDFTKPQAEMLLQRMASTVRGMPRVLAAFVEEQQQSSQQGFLRGDGAPAVAAYESQSGGILEMLEGLHKKFKAQLAEVEEDEANRQHEFDLVLLHTTNTIEKDSSDRNEKIALKEKKTAAAAEAEGELAETKKGKAADEDLKKEIETVYEEKTATYEENQKVRALELEALGKAIEIISSPSVSGSYSKRVNSASFAQQAPVSFLQVGRRGAFVGKALALLEQKAQDLGSRVLMQAAAHAQGNPMEKVTGMIEDLIAKLKEEAAQEAEHKKWCDKELKANKLKRNKKTAQKDQLVSEIEGMESKIADMGANIKELAQEQVDLAEAMQKATQVRDEEKAENLATIADAAAGFKAVGQALVVLKEFYSSQASFLQQVPEMEAYSGQQGSSVGVVGMLEVIQTDFKRLETETTTAEKMAAKEYDTFMLTSTKLKKMKHDEEFKLKMDKDQVEYENTETKKDLRSTEKELARANKYFEQLKPSCLEVKVDYEERVARRKEEIEALNQAYSILDQKSSD